MSETAMALYQYRIKVMQKNFLSPFYILQRLDGISELSKYLNEYVYKHQDKIIIEVEIIDNSYRRIGMVEFNPFEIANQMFIVSKETRLLLFYRDRKDDIVTLMNGKKTLVW